MQFDADLGTLRRQSAPFYMKWQFWWTTVPILLTLLLASLAITLRVTSPNAVCLCICCLACTARGVSQCLLFGLMYSPWASQMWLIGHPGLKAQVKCPALHRASLHDAEHLDHSLSLTWSS